MQERGSVGGGGYTDQPKWANTKVYDPTFSVTRVCQIYRNKALRNAWTATDLKENNLFLAVFNDK